MSRVTEIRYVGYGVEDFDTERAFYANDWGLVEVQSTADMAWFKTHGHDEHHVVRLHKAAQNSVEVIALAVDSREDVDPLQARVAEAGCRIVHEARDLDAPGGGYGFRFFSPDGLPFEISAEVHRLPTLHGRLSCAIRWHGYRPALLWELERTAADPIVALSCPGLDPVWSSTEASGEALLAGTADGLAPAPAEGDSFT